MNYKKIILNALSRSEVSGTELGKAVEDGSHYGYVIDPETGNAVDVYQYNGKAYVGNLGTPPYYSYNSVYDVERDWGGIQDRTPDDAGYYDYK